MLPSPQQSKLFQNLLSRARPEPFVVAPAAPAAPASAKLSHNKPVKLWDLEDKHHCPIIGTCLPMDDLLRFAKRFGFEASLRDDFELHVEAVGCLQTRNAVSETLQKHLDRKYALTIARYAKLKTEAEVMACWKECIARGEVAAPLWATVMHKAVSDAARGRVYNDIHMLSHQVGAGQAADVRRLRFLENENVELKQALHAERTRHAQQLGKMEARHAEAQAALDERASLAAELALLRERVGEFESGQAMAAMNQRTTSLQRANEQLAAMEQRVREQLKSLQDAQEQVAGLMQERNGLSVQCEALERLLLADGDDPAACGTRCECCVHESVPRCILYVGGRTSLVAQYRDLAQRLGVRLVHHDGGLEEALSRLPELIRSADAVVCPTDCISHSAYFNLKSHCKRSGKPCLFFKGAGVSSFAVAMARLSRGEFSMAGAVED